MAGGEEMEQLKESIREYDVLSPLLVRPRGDGRYEIVSGHRRKAACEALGITELPVLVRDMTDDEAVILMVDSNIQREHILPSEKAFAYKMKMEAIKHQGKRGVPNFIPSWDEVANNGYCGTRIRRQPKPSPSLHPPDPPDSFPSSRWWMNTRLPSIRR